MTKVEGFTENRPESPVSLRPGRNGRRLDSVEGKRNDTGLRFVLQKPEEGNLDMTRKDGDTKLG